MHEQIVHAVAGQINKGLVGENDGISGYGGVGHEHGHPGPADSLDEDPALLPNRLNVTLRNRSFGGIRLVLLEIVHGQSGAITGHLVCNLRFT